MQWSASSISLHPGGSILQTLTPLKSTLLFNSNSGIYHLSSYGGKQSRTYFEKALYSTLCSSKITSPSAFMSPESPTIILK